MANKTLLIPVNISEGMFSNEYAVMLKTANGEDVSLYVDKYLIEKKKEGAFLKVTSISTVKNGKQTVLLPSETFETSARWIDVMI